jgi:V-type H+-transporting ATPase subunit H
MSSTSLSEYPLAKPKIAQNLLNLAPSNNLNSMLVQKLLPLVKSFSTRKWSDDEVVDDIKFLKDELEERLENLT